MSSNPGWICNGKIMLDLIIFSVPQCPNGNYLSNYCLKQGWGFNPVAVTTMPEHNKPR